MSKITVGTQNPYDPQSILDQVSKIIDDAMPNPDIYRHNRIYWHVFDLMLGGHNQVVLRPEGLAISHIKHQAIMVLIENNVIKIIPEHWC